MSDLAVLCKLLPKYTITILNNNFCKIEIGSDSQYIHIQIISKNINIIKEIHDNYNHILQFLSLNDFILQSDVTYPYYMHKSFRIRVCINIQSISVNGTPFYSVDKFYQIIHKELDLDSLNKQVIGVDYIEDV